ncbi:hypothetical protein [Flavobacterium sp.]|uniref:hypothetical protein n=1 Tax=Flavobacterium sp. TaxID=239 RepID=UPI00286C9F4A|nr:hypothetical protein [Flavobacterium sp.]
MEQEHWINEVLESTNGMTPAIPDAKLFARIQAKIQTDNIPMRWVWMAAATLLLLVSLNITLVFSKPKKEKTATEVMASYLSKSNQLY